MKNVAIVYGGRSVEHEISVLTALEAADALDTTQFRPLLVYQDLRGRFWVGERLRDRKFYAAFHARSDDSRPGVEEVALLPAPGAGLIRARKSEGIFGAVAGLLRRDNVPQERVLPVDIWMPMLHGTYGEDGCMQGLFELTGLPYTGSRVRASVIGMSKPVTKTIARQLGVPVLDWLQIDAWQWNSRDPQPVLDLVESLGAWPLFVKPANLGSSVAVSKAEDPYAFIAALIKVFQHDTQAIVEPCVTGLSEINVAVRRAGGRAVASVVEMPVRRSDSGVLTYEDKYSNPGGKTKTPGMGMASMARVTDPADLPAEYKEAAKAHACTVYEGLGCNGVSRIDFILDTANGSLYFNEINTLPGSMAHYLWSASRPSLTYTELLTAVIEEAVAWHAAEKRLLREFGFVVLK